MKTIRRKPKKIVAVDFDGTLCFNKYPYIENPNEELLNTIRERRKDFIWILNTCREGKQLEYATKWLKEEQGIEFDYVNQNVPWLIEKYGDCRKIAADIYLDDRNMSIKEFIGVNK